MKTYAYDVEVMVRPVGAQGVFAPAPFTVLLAIPSATAGSVLFEWILQAGDDYESLGIRSINGAETKGVGVDHLFLGKEVE